MNGFIKLHRKLIEWQWYKDSNTKAVFLHLLLLARFSDGGYKQVKLRPGQVVIGRKKLAEDLGMSEQNVRTSIQHLISTNEITIKSTNKFSVVTIVNWEKYQIDDDESTNKVTNNLTNNQPTTNHNVRKKERKKDNNDSSLPNINFKDNGPEGKEEESDYEKWEKRRSKLRALMKEKGMI